MVEFVALVVVSVFGAITKSRPAGRPVLSYTREQDFEYHWCGEYLSRLVPFKGGVPSLLTERRVVDRQGRI